MKESNVIITGNLLHFTPHRPCRSNQNIQWLYNLVAPIFRNWWDYLPVMVTWDNDTELQSDIVYQHCDMPMNSAGFAEILGSDSPEEVLDYLHRFFKETTVVGI